MENIKNGVNLKDKTPIPLTNIHHKDTELDNENKGFPINIFPDELAELIVNAHQTIGFNKDFFAASILSVCATAIGGSNKIDINQYSDTPIFWIALVGNSGDGKTHPLAKALEYFENIDDVEYENYKSLLKDWETNDRNGKKPVYKSTILKKFTIEALAQKLQYNPNILLYQDELMGWINSFNQYNVGSDQQEYLQLYGGKGITVDLKTQEPIRTKSSCVNIIGGIQIKKLSSLSKNGRDADGFMERVLFVYPSNVTRPKKTFEKHPERYEEYLQRTLEKLSQINDTVYTLDKACEQIYGKWDINAINTYGSCSTQAKLDTYLPRLALVIDILHKVNNKDTSTVVDYTSFEKAIELIEYFRINAEKVKGILEHGTNPLEDLSLKYQQLYHDLQPEFKVADEIESFSYHGVIGNTSIYNFLNKKKLFVKVEHNCWKKKL